MNEKTKNTEVSAYFKEIKLVPDLKSEFAYVEENSKKINTLKISVSRLYF